VRRRQAIALLGLLPFAAAGVAGAEFVGQRLRPRRNPAARDFRADHFPNLALRTHAGERVRLYDDLLRGRTVLAHFFASECTEPACVAAVDNLARLQRLLGERCGRDVFLYSFSLAPGRDTPERLERFHEERKLRPGWTLLTGSRADLDLCRARFGIPAARLPAGESAAHAKVVVIGNEPHERWLAAPALTEPEFLLAKLDRVAGVRG
jgi:protein SCO1/2